MLMRSFMIRAATFAVMAVSAVMQAQAAIEITITHSPASFAIKGQPLTLRAKVTGGSGGIDVVTLYYALSRDAAPFPVPMASSGMDMYVGTIETGLLSGLSSLSYYIEAQDRGGLLEETPWYDVQFRDPEAQPAAVAPPKAPSASGTKAGTRTAVEEEDGMSGTTMALIAGGAVALGAGAYFIADGGGGGGGGETSNSDTYTGNSTICEQTPSTPTKPCDTKSAAVVVDANGNVFSDSLLPGTSMSTQLNGNSFNLTASINDALTDTIGTITFKGVIGSDGEILGNIFGSFERAGEEGTYFGTFTLAKQP